MEKPKEICGFALKNSGGFVARIAVLYSDGTNKRVAVGKDILLGQDRTLDFADVGIADGETVQLSVDIVLGMDPRAQQSYVARHSAKVRARYVVSGTTLHNDLGLIGVS